MINAYATEPIQVKRTIRGDFGAITEKTTAVRGRLEQKTRLVRNNAGEQVASSARVYLPIAGLEFLNHDDRIQVSGRTYAILAIERVKGFSDSFLRVDLG